MAEYTGRLRDLYRDMDGRAVVSFRLEEEPVSIDELRETDLTIKVTRRKNRRSLDSNAYFHVMCDKLRQRLKISMARCKNILICRYGQVEYIRDQQVVIKTNIPVEDMLENETLHCQPCGVDIQNGQEINYYRVYRGSHTYDTAEMSRLIDGTVEECKAQGIETATPDQIAHMQELWERSWARKKERREQEASSSSGIT